MGIVDTFLHPRERSYTVSNCLELLSECGLVFQGWVDPIYYYPDAQIPISTALGQRVDSLSEPDVWQAMEVFFGGVYRHLFYACTPQRVEQTYRIDFEGDSFLNYVPIKRPALSTPSGADDGRPARIQPPRAPEFEFDQQQARIFEQIDGQRTVFECLGALEIDPKSTTTVSFARNFFRSLWRLQLVFLRIRSPAANSGRI